MTPPSTGRSLLVLVLVGTDHHPFGRMVRWMDAWAASRIGTVRVLVQHGAGPAPVVAEGRAMLPHDDLVRLVGEADVVVTHGGPATICEVRAAGFRPLVVPRDPDLGEHVDGHQQRFARRVHLEGLVELCEDECTLVAALDRALTDRAWLAISAATEAARVAGTVAAVGAVVRELTRLAAARPGRGRFVPPHVRPARRRFDGASGGLRHEAPGTGP